ncbi:ATP-dependent DNA ligase [Alicyclobacillus dauci]|uniref:DNA ligase (ATP) n=1 Tax=Alicyclobacillus dauci TaxID=1475485 RepID=A0ABY6YXZ0_9BACL|nr:RNA ligase family protein [Alicyclobacillus dauci]WAH35143.1 DNA ligase [Alicyclobacillus dauci]
MRLQPVIPFEPIQTNTFPSGEQWVAQVKWDGVRMLAYKDGSDTRLVNRRLNDRTLQYPEIANIASYCNTDSVILDGEVIALDHGKPSFYEVMKRDRIQSQRSVRTAMLKIPVVYMIFDVLYRNGTWLIERPLQERQDILQTIVTSSPHVQLVENSDDGPGLFAAIQNQGMEGVVIKDLTSPYAIDGKDDRWRKIKNIHDLIAVIGGMTIRDDAVNALLLGLYTTDGELHYIGHVGAGKLSVKDWQQITSQADKLAVQTIPFATVPSNLRSQTIWLEPVLTVKVTYLEWTSKKTLRHPVLEAFVDVPPTNCQFTE